ncbi:hypothetical protein [Collimonas humicola]|uniref:hypothetical protein n=1 Tax=Collimonas humicola TaxID=2825886 RepID=UPI001B8C77AA|nr:hypothetical protein [Collimonas humicola]
MSDSTQLFKNSHEALTFAFNYSSQHYALSPMSKLMTVDAIGSGKGLVSQDGAAQAGLIHAQVGKLSPEQRACIVARYSPRFAECQCCGSRDKVLQEYQEAISTLGQWAVSTFTGMSVRTAREYVVRSYFEKGLTIRAIAEQSKVGKTTLYDYKSKITEKLKIIDHQAQISISDFLQQITEESHGEES